MPVIVQDELAVEKAKVSPLTLVGRTTDARHLSKVRQVGGYEMATARRTPDPTASFAKENVREKANVPTFKAVAFPCPHCEAFAHHEWCRLLVDHPQAMHPQPIIDHFVSECQACHRETIWVRGKLVYPEMISGITSPSADMPDDVKADYEEARSVFSRSPRAAGGLLRIAFEKLFPHLGIFGMNPNDAIGELVKKGLVLGDEQMAMDTLRVFSNQTAHDGFVKLEDQAETVQFLFDLLNLIIQQRITIPKQLKAMYGKMPQSKLDGITKRDAKK